MQIETSNKTQLIEYKGPFCIDILSGFGNIIKQMLNNYPKSSIRLYKLFFELTQNVAKYSIEKSNMVNCRFTGIGHFTLDELDDKFVLRTSNLISKKDGPTLQKYCNEINELDKDGLLKYKSEKRKKTIDAEDIGAHIGIIQIGLLTQAKIQFEVKDYNSELDLFSIWAIIKKEL
jgi:hypothetical protein